jgi:hypothetical protein
MRQRTFVWSLGTMPGTEPGWLPENAAPGWYPGPGFLAAHDLLEHLSDKADWQHELRAAGVSAYDVAGVSHRNYKSIAEDIAAFAARDHHFDVPPAPPLAHKTLPAADEAKVQELVAAIRERVADGMENARKAGAKIPAEAKKKAPTFAERATPWIRLGYRAALRVYGNGKGRATGKLMDDVRAAINLDHDKSRPLKGDRLIVSVDTRAKTFSVKRENANPELSKRERDHKAFMDEFGANVFGVR